MSRQNRIATLPVVLALAIVCSAQSRVLTTRPDTRQATNRDRHLAERIDRYVQSEMRRYSIPGFAIAVLRSGKISILNTYGLANVELGVPVKPETIFQTGSIGKQFTAAAVMILVQEGKIALGDKISKYLCDTPEDCKNFPDAWKDISVRHLLTHTSGLGDYPGEVDLRRDYTEDQYLEMFKKAPLHFATGTRWDYSNVGYVLLGILISKVTGKFYGEFVRDRLFKPLEMSTARLISEADIVPNRAAGYRLVNGELKNQEWVSPSTNSTADGSYYVSILDMAKWDAALTRDADEGNKETVATQGHANKFFNRSTLEQIWTPVRLSDGRVKGYGFGWFTDTIHNRRLVFHGGAWQGFKTYIIRFIDEKLTIIFLANSWQTNDFKIARGLMSVFHPEFALAPIATRPDTIVNREPQVSALVRQVLMQLANDKANKDLFTSDFQAQLFSTRSRQIGDTLRSLSLPVAVIHLAELVDRREENALRVYRYVLTDIGQTLVCTLKLTKDDKIAGLDVVRR